MQINMILKSASDLDSLSMLVAGIVALVSGILMLTRPGWFRNLWKIRTAYEYWGDKAASIYYTVLGAVVALIGLWLMIEFFL